MANKETILNVDVSNETYDSLIRQLFHRIKEKQQAFIVAVNPEKIMKAEQNPELRDLINTADYQIPDGVGVLLASKLKGGQITNRITGIDLMMEIVREAAKQEKRIFLYGAKPGVAEAAKAQLIQDYPNLQVAGVLHGYTESNEYIIDTINQSQADILFVAMGSPRQEEWIRKNQSRLHVSVFQGVGGSFDVIAGNTKRAPAWTRKLGLEWLYRLIVEPWRWKRQLVLPTFLLKVIRKRNKN
ncbi:WecB/TagA/CpsF family glycosyltransferase [Lentibacillus cibarius]|uniref:N-acetylglucosaminyldiphosphoundecaprenol N-acetyl-beta-D-mannosaminyltransferase n=1 Tax=Lentibacillus cibarius TaxID=2583219 RepID=A0A5S3QJD4_9BACI|nr:WecB/TagA/CpsF family glycosyltransferase [Lentibacillus cibarius]TMN21948.1 WecB/TagA/CpsF family glycosyltransferase [Lentibacillus cibarius]